jgi:hypothetical protein
MTGMMDFAASAAIESTTNIHPSLTRRNPFERQPWVETRG